MNGWKNKIAEGDFSNPFPVPGWGRDPGVERVASYALRLLTKLHVETGQKWPHDSDAHCWAECEAVLADLEGLCGRKWVDGV